MGPTHYHKETENEQTLQPYTIELWGCAKPCHLKGIPALQFISLRNATDALCYVTILTFQADLKIPFSKDLVSSQL